MEEFVQTVGEAAEAAIPRRLRGRWERVVVEAAPGPAGVTCSVAGTCHERGTGTTHSITLGPEIAERFADLWGGMAAEGQAWTKAIYLLRSDRTFELDFEYE